MLVYGAKIPKNSRRSGTRRVTHLLLCISLLHGMAMSEAVSEYVTVISRHVLEDMTIIPLDLHEIEHAQHTPTLTCGYSSILELDLAELERGGAASRITKIFVLTVLL